MPKPGNPAHGCLAIAGGIGLLSASILVAAAAWFHTFDPIISMPFVLALGGAGLFIGLSSIGLLIMHRAWRRRDRPR